MSSHVTLVKGATEAILVPHMGGGLSALRHKGEPKMRLSPLETTNPLELACFPMVPYCNRIRNGRFNFNNRQISLPVNFAPSPHTLHGTGWQSLWHTLEQDEDHIALAYHYVADAWPWDFSARLDYFVRDEGLKIELSLTNPSSEAMPYGFGLHPYFNRTEKTRVVTTTHGVWLSDNETMPSVHQEGQAEAFDYEDNCHTGFGGHVEIYEGDRLDLVMRASHNCSCLHIYAPKEQPYFCAEPTSHAPDSFNRQIGLENILPPNGNASMWLDIKILP